MNRADNVRLGDAPFAHLEFIREGQDAFEIEPPLLTTREARFLNREMPAIEEPGTVHPDWLTPEELDNFKKVYRYYPVFAESEL